MELNKHVDDEDKGVAKCDTLGGTQNIAIINESGLYSLVLSSKLPSAKKFKRWVTSEVLPTLRKTGKYSINEMDSKELLARAVIESQRLLEEKDKQIEEMKPKALFADAVSASEGSITVGALAKFLAQNGIDIGQNRLFEWLRDNGYLIENGLNVPHLVMTITALTKMLFNDMDEEDHDTIRKLLKDIAENTEDELKKQFEAIRLSKLIRALRELGELVEDEDEKVN